MIELSLFLLIAVLIADGFLALIVWLRAPQKTVNRIFAALTLSFMAWSATSFYDQTAHTTVQILSLLAPIPFAGAVLVACFFTLFTLDFPENHPNSPGVSRLVRRLLLVTTVPVLALLLGTKVIVAGASINPNNVIIGPGYVLFPLYFLSWVGFMLTNLYLKYRHTKSRVGRLQLSYIFVGFLMTIIVGFTTNVIIPSITRSSTTARFGFLCTLFLTGFIGYTIAAHRLFNIRLLVARSVAYLMLLATLTASYGFAIFAVSRFFFPRTSITPVEMSAFIALAIVMALTYGPLRRFFEKITDGIFFHDHYDSQKVLNSVSTILSSELRLEPVLANTLAEICQHLRLSAGEFVVFEGQTIYQRARHGAQADRSITYAELDSLGASTLVTDELLSGRHKIILEQHDIRVSLPLRTKEGIIGYLLLGDKLSGDIYSSQDLLLLEILRKELAVAIVNARAYEEIARFNVTLQEQVAKATQRLRTANRNLKVLDKAKDEFLSMASHQLGTPLTAIIGYLSMALDNDLQNMTAEQKEFVQYALEASERMSTMSSDLLNVSRLNAGRFVIRREPTDLGRMVGEEVTQLRPAADRKGLKLIYQPPTPALPPVPLDVSKTRQVIMNFIDNAIYYTEHGQVEVTLELHGGAVALQVKDSGMGVPPAEQAKLFAKFYRAANARQVRPDGTGLGLYLAKRVIEEQGGSIIFSSVVGQGSTFGFVLPLAEADNVTKNKHS